MAHKQKQESINGKLEILDVKAKLSNGNVVDIEMQARGIPEIRNRISYYISLSTIWKRYTFSA